MIIGILFFIAIIAFILLDYSRVSKHKTRRFSWHYHETSDGSDFEELIEEKLAKLEAAGGKVIRDCYLRWDNGTTTQVDDILIFRSGIYVIECKDYSGWIFGNGEHEYWTQTLPYGYRGDYVKTNFYNPVKQNRTHIKCIRQKLQNDTSIPIHSIVVFGDNCTFKEIENTMGAHIIKVGNLYETIHRIEQRTGSILSEADVEFIYLVLIQDSADKPYLSEEHIRNVERIKRQKEQEKDYTGTTCPRCGSPLVLRSGHYGRFYGCVRYPSCKYTRNIE